MRALRHSIFRRLPLLIAAIAAVPSSALAAGVLGGGDKNESQPAAEAGDESTLVESPMFKLGWPKIEMPKFSWKPGFGGKEESASTAMTPEGNPISRALDKVADTSKSAADKVRGAWGAAIEKLTPGGGDDATQTAKADKPGFFSRMFAPEEPKQSETVQEFLAQERVGTTR